LRENSPAGGAEHEVFVPEGSRYVWKITRPNRWGLISATAMEYLERLEVLNEVSGTDILIEGVAVTNVGVPSLVTSMAFVPGVHPDSSELHSQLAEEGWELIPDPDQMLGYRQSESGVVMRDAHPKNFIKTGNNLLVPVDVIFVVPPEK